MSKIKLTKNDRLHPVREPTSNEIQSFLAMKHGNPKRKYEESKKHFQDKFNLSFRPQNNEISTLGNSILVQFEGSEEAPVPEKFEDLTRFTKKDTNLHKIKFYVNGYQLTDHEETLLYNIIQVNGQNKYLQNRAKTVTSFQWNNEGQENEEFEFNTEAKIIALKTSKDSDELTKASEFHNKKLVDQQLAQLQNTEEESIGGSESLTASAPISKSRIGGGAGIFGGIAFFAVTLVGIGLFFGKSTRESILDLEPEIQATIALAAITFIALVAIGGGITGHVTRPNATELHPHDHPYEH